MPGTQCMIYLPFGKFAAYPAYAAPPGATNRCFRHEAKGFQLATKSISTRNQRSSALSLYPLSVQVVKHILHPLRFVTRRTARRLRCLRCLRCFVFRVHQRCICLKGRYWSHRGKPTESPLDLKIKVSGYIQTPAWCFLCILLLFGGSCSTRPSPLKFCTNQMVEGWELGISWSLPSHQYRHNTSSSTIWWSFPSRTVLWISQQIQAYKMCQQIQENFQILEHYHSGIQRTSPNFQSFNHCRKIRIFKISHNDSGWSRK